MKRFLAIAVPATVDLSLILRGLFAASVVFWHVYGSPNSDTLPSWLNLPGRVAVWMFFGISGYVIALGYFNGRYGFSFGDLKKFASRRIMRILPLYWLLSLLAILILLMKGNVLPFDFFEGFKQIFALKLNHTYSLVGVFWTLGIEVQFYLLAPLICALIIFAGRGGLSVLLSGWLLTVVLFGGAIDNRTVFAALQHFLAGMFVARLVLYPTAQRLLDLPISSILTITLGLLALATVSAAYHKSEIRFWQYQGGLLTDLAIVCLLLAHCSIERLRIDANSAVSALLVLGVLSYGVYAWHGLLLTYFPWFLTSVTATFVASLALAYLSYQLIEQPARRLMYK